MGWSAGLLVAAAATAQLLRHRIRPMADVIGLPGVEDHRPPTAAAEPALPIVNVLLTAAPVVLTWSVISPVKLKTDESAGASVIDAVIEAATPVFMIRIAPWLMLTVRD